MEVFLSQIELFSDRVIQDVRLCAYIIPLLLLFLVLCTNSKLETNEPSESCLWKMETRRTRVFIEALMPPPFLLTVRVCTHFQTYNSAIFSLAYVMDCAARPRTPVRAPTGFWQH